MQNITVKRGQSLFDLAIQAYGSAEGVFALALENDLSITDDLQPGQVLSYKPENVINKQITEYYRVNGIKPATAILAVTEPPIDPPIEQTGIGYMIIGETFIIS